MERTKFHKVNTEKLGTKYLNEGSFKEYQELNKEYFSGKKIKDDDFFEPYQTIDMREYGKVKFIKSGEVNLLIQNLAELKRIYQNYNHFNYAKKNNNCIADIPSDIDLFKMNRIGPNKYKYLVQYEVNSRNSLNVLNKVMDDICSMDINKIFVPYIPNFDISTGRDIKYTKGTSQNEFWIANDELYIDYLKDEVNKNNIQVYDIGRIIYSLDILFNSYKVIGKPDIRQVIMEDYKRLSGLNKEEVAQILWDREQSLNKMHKLIKENIAPSNTCQIEYKDCYDLNEKLIEYLSGNNSLIMRDDDQCVLMRQICWYGDLKLDLLINSKLSLLNNPHIDKSEVNINKFIDACNKNFIFSEYDSLETSLKTNCPLIFNDKRIEDKVKILLNIELNNNAETQFHVHEEYMPEVYKMIEKGDVDKIFENRQLVLGDYDYTVLIKKCNTLFRVDPFVDQINLKNVEWSIAWNKAIIACVLSNDLVFPIRIDMGNLNKIGTLFPYVDDPNNILLGSLLTKATGERFNNQIRFYKNL